MPQPLLEGPAAADDSVRLRREIAGLEQELREAKDEAAEARQAAADAVQAIRALRQQLQGFYNALKMVFGEISRVDAGSVEAAAPQHSQRGGRDPRWEAWISKLGGQQGQFIDALLTHGPMTRGQLAKALSCHPDTVSNLAYKLKSLLSKDGGKFTLKDS